LGMMSAMCSLLLHSELSSLVGQPTMDKKTNALRGREKRISHLCEHASRWCLFHTHCSAFAHFSGWSSNQIVTCRLKEVKCFGSFFRAFWCIRQEYPSLRTGTRFRTDNPCSHYRACPDCLLTKTSLKWVWRGLVDLSTIFNGCTPCSSQFFFFYRTNVVYTTSRKAV
jgi:hypothetical protein